MSGRVNLANRSEQLRSWNIRLSDVGIPGVQLASHSLERIRNRNDEDAAQPSFFVATKPISDEFEGRYEILEEIGKGGMGVVYKARQPALQKLYAIKMLHSVHINETILRFEREAKAISKLDHPNLITSHDFGVSADGRPYMVMDFIEGTSLAQLIEKNRKLPLRQTLEICIQIAKGMAFAHAQGVLHRDLKPGNIMLIAQPDGSQLVKIIDFGIAKVVEANEPHNLTQTGDVFGSPYYMSPEQAVGRGIDERSDIYSLGCVMYEMLTGTLPFRGASAFETLYAHLNQDVPTLKLNAVKEQFPAPVEKLVGKCLAKDQKDRWQSMSELEYEMTSILKVLDSPLKTLLHNIDFEPSMPKVKFKIWHGIAFSALSAMGIVALISFWPTFTPPVHEQRELTPKEYLEEQKLSDPDELARQVIVNGTTDVSLESLDCGDEALKWCRERNDIVKLNLCGTSITGYGIKYLDKLPLRVLQMNQTGVAELDGIDKIRTLESLELNETLISDQKLAILQRLPNLKVLRVQTDKLNDEAIDQIIKIPNLESLSIGFNSGITDSGVNKLIVNCKKLKMLKLVGLRISDDAVDNIGQLHDLRVLDLSGTNITDKAIAKVSRMPLNALYLSATNVTDAALSDLAKCETLDHLLLNGCPKLTRTAVGRLRDSLAHCKVDHNKTSHISMDGIAPRKQHAPDSRSRLP